MLDEELPDVVGFEWDEANELLRGRGWTVKRVDVGDDSGEGPTRILRQSVVDRVITVTCAQEDWGVDRR